jgi:hypothetical protein
VEAVDTEAKILVETVQNSSTKGVNFDQPSSHVYLNYYSQGEEIITRRAIIIHKMTGGSVRHLKTFKALMVKIV